MGEPRRGTAVLTDGGADPYDLARFVAAQDRVYEQVRRELSSGRKTSHWMWFVFPQIDGLGISPTARKYALSGPDEARAYLAHPVLGPRLVECVRLVLALQGRTIHEIFGRPDDLKFRSSMTLFAQVATGTDVFRSALDRCFGGVEDEATMAILAGLRS